jgi:hypothetical protein
VRKASLPHWQTTALWRAMATKSSQHGVAVRKTLESWMDSVEVVLAKGGTSPLNFTLHDDGHAFRVAETMVKIIPQSTIRRLSVYELALLLLSAYLHDIGMTPAYGQVLSHYNFLMVGAKGGLSQAELDQFQGWLDEEGHGVTPPLCQGTPTVNDLTLAQELTAYYCRYRHNDWSEKWIRENCRGLKLGQYADWVEDLVALCRSHHDGYSELITDRFNLRIATGSERMNLRFLAAVLRVADVLENDPERTPEVVLRHRRIQGESLIHWYKPHAMSILVRSEQITVTARPQDARSHKAVMDTIAQIDDELQLCRRLADEGRFGVGLGPALDRPNWTLPGRVSDDVRPSADAYVFIDGSFRPDTEKVLHLLGGTELYRDPLVAIRELLSNAFDAVREKIAHKRIRLHDPLASEHERNLGQLESVELRLEINADGTWIVCKDTGVGMSKAIIEHYLLVSGRSMRRHVVELARSSEKAGFRLVRSGQFGIGVLSFFMLSDKVVIKTRRCQECADGDTEAWSFESEGIGTFGELRHGGDAEPGTEMRLRLRPEVVGGDLSAWYTRLVSYVQKTLVKIPCRLTVGSTLPTSNKLALETGWMLNTQQITELCLRRAPSYPYRHAGELPDELLPHAERKKREAARQHWAEMVALMRSSLKFRTTEGELPERLGTFRLHVPYFELAGGISLLFLRPSLTERKTTLERVGSGYSARLGGESVLAWRGIRIEVQRDGGFMPRFDSHSPFKSSVPGILEVDLESNLAAKIGVDRYSLELKDAGRAAVGHVRNKSTQVVSDLISDHLGSIYTTINYNYAGLPSLSQHDWHWVSGNKESGDRIAWCPMRFPATVVGPWGHPGLHFTIRGLPLAIIPPLPDQIGHFPHNGLSWNQPAFPPTMVGFLDVHTMRPVIVPIWMKPMSRESSTHPCGAVATFPSSWATVCGVKFSSISDGNRTIWNRDHELLKLIDAGAWRWCQSTIPEEIGNHLPYRTTLTSRPELAAAWLLRCLQSARYQFWLGIRDRDPEFLPKIWELVFGENARGPAGWTRAVMFSQGTEDPDDVSDDSELRVVTPERWVDRDLAQDGSSEFNACFPEPDMDFCIQVK